MLDWQGHIKLVDFGLSRRVIEKSQKLRSFVGSPGYTSPDISCKDGYNFMSDIYNIGILIYDLMHGRPPYTYIEEESGLLLPSNSNILEIDPNLSSELKDLLFLLLEKNPQNRLQSSNRTASLLFHPWFKLLNEFPTPSKVSPFPPTFLTLQEATINSEELSILKESLYKDMEETLVENKDMLAGLQEDIRDEYSLSSFSQSESVRSYETDGCYSVLNIFKSGISTGQSSKYEGISKESINGNNSCGDELDDKPKMTIKVFRNKTKLTRENIIKGSLIE